MSTSAKFPKYRTPLHQAKGWGSAKSGTGHFWWQRVTAIALALLVPYIVFLLACVGVADVETLRATIAQPWNAILFTVFAIALFWHAKLGLQVVIEDYQHGESRYVLMLLLNLYVVALGGIALFAILKLAFAGHA